MSRRMPPQIIPGEENSSLQTAEYGGDRAPLGESANLAAPCTQVPAQNISPQLFSQLFAATSEVLLPTQLQMVFILERCASSLPGLASMQVIWSQDVLLAYFPCVFSLSTW